MAVAVTGGLIASTVLSLLVVPSVFTYLDDLEQQISRTVERLRGRRPEPALELVVQAAGGDLARNRREISIK